jgi:hypothetical protein
MHKIQDIKSEAKNKELNRIKTAKDTRTPRRRSWQENPPQ